MASLDGAWTPTGFADDAATTDRAVAGGRAMTSDAAEPAELLVHGYRYALALTHDAHDAEDLVQEAWCAILNSGGPRNRAYLFSAVRTRFIDRVRRERRGSAWSLDDPHGPGADQIAATDDDALAALSSRERVEALLGRLRAEERELLYLAVVEGYSTNELVELTERPRGTVLSMLHRARNKLREWLEADPSRRL